MSFVDRLRKLFSSPPDTTQRSQWINVRCHRCGEVIPVRIDLLNDLSLDYDTGEYTAHKTVVGDGKNRCFQRVELVLTYDAHRKLLTQEAVGGVIVGGGEPVTD